MAKTDISPLQAVIELNAQIEEDSERNPDELHLRDRRIGQEISNLQKRPYKQLRAWLSKVRENSDCKYAQTAGSAERIIRSFLIISGFLLGCAATAAGFNYDGQAPVNVLLVFSLFIFLPLVTSVVSLLTFLPASLTRFIPGSKAASEIAQSISPARLRSLVERFLPRAQREQIRSFLASSKRHQKIFSNYQKWTALYSAHLFTLSLLCGVALYFVLLIATSDLAFGWSTTLGLSPEQIHSVTQRMSNPWTFAFPDATPSLELIEESRYFRFKEGTLGESNNINPHPEALGAWWQFLLFAIITYGILPRTFLALVSSIKRDGACNKLLINFPGTESIFWRLNSAVISTQSLESDTKSVSPKNISEDKNDTNRCVSVIFPDSLLLINWAQTVETEGVITNFLQKDNSERHFEIVNAGYSQDFQADQLALDKLKSLSPQSGLFVFVRAWEPPTEECIDFLLEMRKVGGDKRSITVLPLASDMHDGITSGSKRELEIWQRRIEKTADPRLFVKSLDRGKDV